MDRGIVIDSFRGGGRSARSEGGARTFAAVIVSLFCFIVHCDVSKYALRSPSADRSGRFGRVGQSATMDGWGGKTRAREGTTATAMAMASRDRGASAHREARISSAAPRAPPPGSPSCLARVARARAKRERRRRRRGEFAAIPSARARPRPRRRRDYRFRAFEPRPRSVVRVLERRRVS